MTTEDKVKMAIICTSILIAIIIGNIVEEVFK